MTVVERKPNPAAIAKGGNLVPGASSFNHDIETNGNSEWQPAKVKIWNLMLTPKKKKLRLTIPPRSILPTCLLGIRHRNIHRSNQLNLSIEDSMLTQPFPIYLALAFIRRVSRQLWVH